MSAAARRRVAAAGAASAALLAAAGAAASTGFPEAIQADLALAYAPACSLCHLADAEPVGPATKPFSRSLEARGMVAGDTASLADALAKMESDHVDSDGDGALDVDELSWGGDPNTADVPAGAYQEPPTYGCSAAPPGPAIAGPLGSVAALALAASRMRRRGGRRP